MELLDRPENAFVFDVSQINARGDVLGTVSVSGEKRAILWSGTNVIRTLPAGDVFNDNLVVAGSLRVGQIAIEIPKYAAVITPTMFHELFRNSDPVRCFLLASTTGARW